MAAILESLAKTHAAQVFANTPDIPPKKLWDTAYELWWHGPMYEAEDQGVPLDDASEEGFIAAFVDAYEALRSRAGETEWSTPALYELKARLVEGGVSPVRIAQLEAFVAESGADHGPGELDLEAFAHLMAHLHGLEPKRPGSRFRPDVWLEDEWAELFGPVPEWDSVEERLVAWLIRLPKDAAESARDRIYRLPVEAIVEGPDAEVYPRFRELLLAAGEIPELCLRWSVDIFFHASTDTDGNPTSFGRFLLELPFDDLFDVARDTRRISALAELLLTVDPTLYEAHAARFEAEAERKPVWKVDIGSMLLRLDPDRYEVRAWEWYESLEDPMLRMHLLIYLAELGRQPERVLSSVEATLKELGPRDVSASDHQRADPDMLEVAEFPNSSAKLCLVVAVLRSFGAVGVPAVRHFQCEQPGWEIRFYVLLDRWVPGDATVAEILVDGLGVELGDSLGGLLTRKSYMRQLTKVLAAYDLVPHRETIAAAAKRAAPDAKPFIEKLLR